MDKPPVGFWLQVISTKLFGFTPFAVFLPQALAGVLSVVLLYWLVRLHFGPVAGLIAAAALALSPISVVTNRNNTIDSTLLLVLLLAAWATFRAIETDRLRWLVASGLLIALGFNIKMLEAYLVVPAFALAYLLSSRKPWLRRAVDLAISGVTMVALSFLWVIVVDLVPAGLRPWVGSTSTNSELGLAIGYNGVQRLLGMGGGSGGAGGFTGTDPVLTTAQLQTLIKEGKVRYFLLSASSSGSNNAATVESGASGEVINVGGPNGNQSAAVTWVRQNCTTVAASAWQSSTSSGSSSSLQLYDCTG